MRHRSFPSHSRPWDEVRAAMEAARAGDLPWYDQRSFKPAYYAGDDLVAVAEESFLMYLAENAIFAGSSYPSLAKYERELIAMLLDILRAPDGAGGNTSTGGTETIVMCMKTARDWARERRPRATAPEIIVPRTAHAAFDKGGHMLGIKVVRMAESPHWRADIDGMAQAINDNTIMIVGSAPPFPYGETDPIADIAALAERHGLWMHVDACIGGMILPFMRKLGEPIPDFDFSVPGVTSMSVDVHKFGYANKGLSAVLLRDAALEAYQRTVFSAWPAGRYSTANILGSRSGGPLASGWAVMNYLGEEGYLRIYREQLAIKQRLMAGVRAIDGLVIIGAPHALHFSFGAPDFDIYAVEEGMAQRGWLSVRMREPKSILLWINRSHAEIVDNYLADLAEVVEAVKAGEIRARTAEASTYST